MSDHITPYYLHLLNEDYQTRNKRNSSYSIRAYAKQLDINPGVLNQILNGKRGLPFQLAKKVIEKLKLTEKQEDLFMRSAFYSRQELDNLQKERSYKNVFLMTEEEKYTKIMCEWEYYAFIALMDVHNFSDDLNWIASKLGVVPGRIEEIIAVLIGLKIIKKGDNTFLCDFDKISYGIDRDSEAFKTVQKNNMLIASKKIDQYANEICHFNSLTLSVQPKNIRQAKLLIDDFIVRITSLLEDGEQVDVYKFCVQLFPISLTETEREENR